MTLPTTPTPTFADWEAEGLQLRDRVAQTEWEIGDWLNRGTSQWSEQAFERAKAMFARDRRKPVVYRETCLAFPPERRDMNIGFDHYVELRKLPAPEAERILDHVRTGVQTIEMTKGEAKNVLSARQGQMLDDPDPDDAAYRPLAQAWNRAPKHVRQMLVEQIEETGLGVIDL